MVFPSAFFTSLLIPVVLAFGTQDSPCLPCVPICVLIQPIFSYLLFCLGFRTSSFLFVPPCYCSFCWVLLGKEYFSWCSMAKDSSCLPFVSILVSLSVPNLSPYFSISIAILLSGCFRSKESPVPHFSLHCSVFFVLVALGTGLKSHLFSYSSLYFTLTCGCSLWVLPGHSMLLVLCLSPCLSPLFSPTRALTSLSLSLAVLLSRCLFGHMILFVSHLFPYLSPLFSSSCILNSLPIAILLSGSFLASCVSLYFSSFAQASLLVY